MSTPQGASHGRSTRELAVAHLPALVSLGLLYGLTEAVWQSFFAKTPDGLPGDAGPGWLATLALGLCVFGVPALVASAVALGRRGVQGPWLVWVAGVLPTGVLVVDRVATRWKISWMRAEEGGPLHALAVVGVAFGASLVLGLLGLWLLRWSGWPRRASWNWVAVPVAVALALAGPLVLWKVLPRAGMPAGGDPSGDPRRPNVLLLSVDTLRQDALGVYGGMGPTPRLDALVSSGTRFDGWAVSPWTRPSFGAIFSGLAPTGNGGAPGRALNPDTDSWVERMRDAGWGTAAVVSNPHLRRRFGFDRGFEWFEHSDEVEWLAPITRSLWGVWLSRQITDRGQAFRGDNLVRTAQDWLRGEGGSLERPWLLWVHTMDPHLPYHLRGAAGKLHASEEPDWLRDLGDGWDAKRRRFFDLPAARAGEVVVTPEARAALRRLYQTEVGFLDHWAGELVETAREVSGDRPLLWVLVSDHGEEFWEDGGFEHGHSLGPFVLRVPLAMGGIDRIAPGRVGGGMKISDIGPTLLSLLELPPMDPRRGSRLETEDLDPAFLDLVSGHDRSPALRRGPGGWGCSPPAMVAEGMLYGPAQTRLQHADGSAVVRNDETGDRVRTWLCGEPQAWPPYADAPDSARVAREDSGFWALDLWRQRAEGLGVEVQRDPELDRQLRALGYAQ